MKSIMTVFVVMSLAGCAAVSSSSLDTSASDSAETSYVGGLTISGQIAVSSSDLSQVEEVSLSSSLSLSSFTPVDSLTLSSEGIDGLTDQVLLNSGSIKVYELSRTGGYVDIGVSSNVMDGEYEISNLADNRIYVIVASKSGNDKILYVTDIVDAVDGATDIEADLSVETTRITEIVRASIEDEGGTEGVDMTSEDLTSLEEAANTAMESLDLDDISLVDDEPAGDFSEDRMNQDMIKKAEVIGHSDLVLDAKAIVKSIFGIAEGFGGESQNGIDVSDFIINSFAEKYIIEKESGTSVTNFGTFIAAFLGSINEDLPGLKSGDTSTEYKENIRVAIDLKIEAIRAYYEESNISDTVDIPDVFASEDFEIIKMVFDEDAVEHWDVGTLDSQEVNTAQSAFMFKWMGLFDEEQALSLVPSAYISELQTFVENNSASDFYDPLSMITALDFVRFEEGVAEVIHAEVRSSYRHIGGTSYSPVISIDFEILLPNMSKDDIAYAQIKYTDTAGEAAIANIPDIGEVSELSVSAISESIVAMRRVEIETQREVEVDRLIFKLDPSKGDFLTDFSSGPAILELIKIDGTVLAEQQVELIRFGGEIEKINGSEGPPIVKMLSDTEDSTSLVFSWDDFVADSGSEIPEGHELKYAVEFGIYANLKRIVSPGLNNFDKVDFEVVTPYDLYPDYDQSRSWKLSKKWDFEYHSGRSFAKIWSSWDSGRFMTDSAFTPNNEFYETLENDTLKVRYAVYVWPVIVNEINTVIWEGNYAARLVEVEVPEAPWSVTLNGTVEFIEGFFDNDKYADSDGTWKVGLFVGAFTDDDYSPISMSNISYVTDLIGSGESRQFELPVMTNANNPLESRIHYKLWIWFDQNEVSTEDVNYSKWTDYFDYKSLSSPVGKVLDSYTDMSVPESDRRVTILEPASDMLGDLSFNNGVILERMNNGSFEQINISLEVEEQELVIDFR